MADGEPKPLVFISYSHKDGIFKDQVLTHLGGLSLLSQLEPWHDGDIGAGEHWYEDIEEKLNGCTVAVLLISANFLNSKFCIQTELPILLERRRRQKMMIMPILVESCFWEPVPWLNAIQMRPGNGDVIEALTKPKRNAAYTEIVREIHGFLESDDAREAVTPSIRQTQQTTIRGDNNQVVQIEGSHNTIIFANDPKADTPYPALAEGAVDLTRLPTSGFDVVGRDKELQLLNEAFDGTTLNVVSLRAWGGVGKSTLVNKWCEYLAADNYRGAGRVFAWSFYSQGASERVTSADAFIDAALRFFGEAEPAQGSPWARGERLAELVGKEKAILILDGMEPLQDRHQGIKDPALARLVEGLAAKNAGLCVITTREPVKELTDFPETTAEKNLEHLSKEAGRALLRIKGLRAPDVLLEQVSDAFGNHALALDLLANFLKLTRRPVADALNIPDLPDISVNDGKHPRRVMAAFFEHFGEGPELDLLHVIGLFDRPADGDCIAALREPVVPGLTERLSTLDQIGWLALLEKLRKLGLLAEASHYDPNELDAHPLVREHFGAGLRALREDAWQAGHERLYEHLKEQAEHRPDSLAAMAPLFQAVHHGCQAGRRQAALDEVYFERIVRQGEAYLVKKLGAFGADLGLVASFFEQPFEQPSADLTEGGRAWLLNQAASGLRALGRLGEAVAPMRAGLEMQVEQENWQQAAAASNLAELQLALGEVVAAETSGEAAIDHADRSGDKAQRMTKRTRLADARHQAGALEAANALFEDAETMQAERQSDYPRLYSLQGYLYCELLLTRGQAEAVRERGAYGLELANKFLGRSLSLIDIGLDHLSLGRAALALGDRDEARTRLDQAVDGLRESGQIQELTRGLLARAAFFRETDPDLARKDLDEVMRIAKRCGLRLHECDAHLESARLALAESRRDDARPHLKSAASLVTACGYHRRDGEIAELKEKLSP